MRGHGVRNGLGLLPLLALGAASVGAVLPASAQDKGQATLCQTLEPPVLDPTAGAAQAIREVTYANIFEGLVGIDRAGKIVPRLAESWAISPDNLTYTFKLRPGVSFHDGSPMTSADVKYSLERAVAPDSKNAQKWIFTPIASVETPDASTVKVTLKQVTANFLYGLGWGDAIIVSEKSAANNATAPVGTGPYRLDRWTRGDRLSLVAADGWWGGKPAIPRVTFRFINDPQAQLAAIQSGDCDALTNFGAAEALETLKADKRLTVSIGKTEGETIVAMNNGKKPLDDIRVRRALAHAIDRNQVNVGATNGTGTPIGSHFSPAQPGYVDLTGRYPYDPAKAKALLAEAGVSGLTLSLKVPPPAYARRSSEIVAAMLGEVGIKVSIENIEFPQWLDRVFKNKDYDLTIISHTEPLDINIYNRPDYYFQYRSPAFAEIMAKIDATTDDAARIKLYGDAQRQLAEDSVNVFLFVLPKITVAKTGLKGMWTDWPIPATPLTDLSWQ
ncbi:ABC transporter substrate-binding protein [Prosthecomicrobium sp. N25]|uniref:ABC transporter substrate-binding protein n=1 Tax=Prosthecomicrobium sp. N25 TaxID=3129254 RepID=UPI0030770864